MADGLCPECLLNPSLHLDLRPSAFEGGRDGDGSDPDAEDLGPEVGQRVGGYELVERIGEGGFGSVFRARQEWPVRREVALKVIKPGMDTREVVSRFEAERQALAVMDHPNIARVFDGGATASGSPYFVMELVRGEPITDYCARHRLGTRQRVGLFAQVCRAVQHAHAKGLIHRDIKPTNVLVARTEDGSPVPKVIDFGIAKATGGAAGTPSVLTPSLLTQACQFVGTPDYMSPEQATASAGGPGVDTRSDIYSLGVLLYELLTGTRPFERELHGKGLVEVQRVLTEVEPQRPSVRLARGSGTAAAALAREVRGELDWIVMKCLGKNPSHRYESAGALAADVARHLEGDVVTARPPARAYRLAKFVRRNKAWVAAGLAVAATLLAGSVGTGVGFVRARHAQAKAERDAARADATSRFMREMFTSAQPDQVGRGRDVRVADVLDRAADTIAGSLAGRPEAEIDVRHMLGDTYAALGLYPAAEQNLRRAYALAQSAPGPEAEQTLSIASRLARVLNARKETRPEGFALARTAFETSRKALGEQHRTTRSVGNQLAWATFQDGKLAEAERLYRRLLAGERAAPDGDAKRTGAVINNLSRVLGSLGRLRDAEALTREALSMSSDETDGINHGKKLFQLAGLLADQGRLADARAVYENNLARQMERLGEDHIDTWDTRDALAQLYTRTGEFGKALAIRRRMLDRALAQSKDDSFDLGSLMFDVGHLLARVGGHEGEAREMLERSVGMTRRLREEPAREGWRATSLWFGLGGPGRWTSESLRRQVWCAVDDLMVDHPPRTFSLDEFEWGALRFRLRRWKGAPGSSAVAATALPAFEGGVAELRRLPEPEAGLYVLDLEVPRAAPAAPADTVRGRAWLLFLPWETASYPFTDMDPERHPEVWAEMVRREPPSNRRSANALALCTLLTPDVPPGYRETFFGVAAAAELRLPPGAYRLVTSSDDGVRVWLDDRLLIDRWVGRPLATDAADFTSDGGPHGLRVEFFQGIGHYKLWLRVEALEPAATPGLM